MKIIFTKDLEWLAKWDEFVANEDKGSHLLLSDWISSYHSYGFGSEFCLAVDNGKIVAGYAAVIAKALFYKFYIVPFGPIATKGYEPVLDELVASVPVRGKFHKTAYAHIAIPSGDDENQHLYSNLNLTSLQNSKPGHLFRFVYSSNGLNWIKLENFTEETLLESFKTSVRRDIRSAMRKDLEVKILESESELQSGYDLCLQNASANGYALRDWNSFKPALIALVEKNHAKMISVYKDGDLKGVILLIKSGNFYTYILGGTKKEKPDLLAGHLLQWEAMKQSLAENADGYNISLGGSQGVVAFKGDFNTRQLLFTHSKFHWILRPTLFKSYLFFEKSLKPHKQIISKMLLALKKSK